jgi:hypothetical protein
MVVERRSGMVVERRSGMVVERRSGMWWSGSWEGMWCRKAVWANRGDDHKERRSAGAQERRSAGAQERRSAGAQERRSAGAQERRSADVQMCRCADVQMCRCAERRFGPTEAMITMSCRADVRPNRIAQDSAG